MGVLRSKLSDILLSIKQELMTRLSLPTERVIIADPEALTTEVVQADQIVILWPDQQFPDSGIVTGAGRVDARQTRWCVADIRTRLGLDGYTGDSDWLMNISLGHLNFEHSVLDSLECFLPLDTGQTNALTASVIHVGPGQPPTKHKSFQEWGQSTLAFEVEYIPDLDQTRQ